MNHEDAERRIAAGLISQLGETLDELHETRSRLHVAIWSWVDLDRAARLGPKKKPKPE